MDKGELWDASLCTANHPAFGIAKELLCLLSYAGVCLRSLAFHSR